MIASATCGRLQQQADAAGRIQRGQHLGLRLMGMAPMTAITTNQTTITGPEQAGHAGGAAGADTQTVRR